MVYKNLISLIIFTGSIISLNASQIRLAMLENDAVDQVKALLDQDPTQVNDFSPEDKVYTNPLAHARSLAMAKLLLNKHNNARRNDAIAFKILKIHSGKKNVFVNHQGTYRATGSYGDPAIIALLIQEIDYTESHYVSALYLTDNPAFADALVHAVQKKHGYDDAWIKQFVSTYHYNPSGSDCWLIHGALSRGSIKMFQWFLKNGADLTGEVGYFCLTCPFRLEKNREKVIALTKMFLDAGARVRYPDGGNIPLVGYVISHGMLEILKLYVERGGARSDELIMFNNEKARQTMLDLVKFKIKLSICNKNYVLENKLRDIKKYLLSVTGQKPVETVPKPDKKKNIEDTRLSPLPVVSLIILASTIGAGLLYKSHFFTLLWRWIRGNEEEIPTELVEKIRLLNKKREQGQISIKAYQDALNELLKPYTNKQKAHILTCAAF